MRFDFAASEQRSDVPTHSTNRTTIPIGIRKAGQDPRPSRSGAVYFAGAFDAARLKAVTFFLAPAVPRGADSSAS